MIKKSILCGQLHRGSKDKEYKGMHEVNFGIPRDVWLLPYARQLSDSYSTNLYSSTDFTFVAISAVE